MSKLSQLKQEAYQAGKKRNWDQAIILYEQILEKDKNNPTVINELGDLCLKTGDTQRAIRHFLNAASKYRQTGLLNNAVAIYKKILRYEGQNLNAHWYLAETRAGQGLAVEGEQHAMQFLAHSERVTADIKEIFLKRCIQLFELLPDSRPIQERLVLTFRSWSLNLESARAQCLLASITHGEGDSAAAARMAEDAADKAPEVRNYPEFQKWNLLANPSAAGPAQAPGFGSLDLPGAEAPPAAGPSDASYGDLDLGARPDKTQGPSGDETAALRAKTDPAGAEKDDEGCFTLGNDGDESALDDLVAVASGFSKEPPEAEEPPPPSVNLPSIGPESEGASLDDLLASAGDEAGGSDSSQLATITSEIGAVVGGEADDAGRLYEMGLVYLEMGLFDQACESFETAAADDEFTVRAHEMWGITLQRANRLEEAIETLTNGLAFAADGSREQHGLQYHLGRAHELAGRVDEAVARYREIRQVDPTFLDVGQRLKRLVKA